MEQRRRWTPHAPLRAYIQERLPGKLPSCDSGGVTLGQILHCLREIVYRGKLYDERNPQIILCDPGMDRALGTRAFHLCQIKELVCKQLVEDPDEANGQPVRGGSVGMPHGLAETSANIPNDGPAPSEEFRVRPEFLRVLRTLDDIDRNREVFSYSDLTKLLSQYLLKHRARFFDERNISVALVDGDDLGAVFGGIKAFHRTQMAVLLRKQLIELGETEKPARVNARGQQKQSGGTAKAQSPVPPDNQNMPDWMPSSVSATRAQQIMRTMSQILENRVREQFGGWATPTIMWSHPDLEQRLVCLNSAINPARGIFKTATGAQLAARGRAVSSTNPPSASDSSNGATRGHKRAESVSPAGADGVRRADKRRCRGGGDSTSSATEDYDSGETIYSMMGYETVAIDTINPDTSSSSSDDDDDDDFYGFEEIGSDDESTRRRTSRRRARRRYGESDLKGSKYYDAGDVTIVFGLESDEKERDFWADSESESDSDSKEFSTPGSEMGQRASDARTCRKCNVKLRHCGSTAPWEVRYCGSCWNERKGLQPDRPKPKHRRRESKKEKNKRTEGQAVKSSSTVAAAGSSEPSGSSQETLPDSGTGSQELFSANEEEGEDAAAMPPVAVGFVDRRSRKILSTPRQDRLCNFCLTREKNAGIIHGRVTHQICCYPCAKKLVKKRKPCPVCRRKIEKITEIIIA